MLSIRITSVVAVLCACAPLSAEPAQSFDAARAFGARPSVSGMTLSPDGKSVAYIAPGAGGGTQLVTRRLDSTGASRGVLGTDGKPYRLTNCGWVSSDRLVCEAYGILKDPTYKLLSSTRIIAVNADGSNIRELSMRNNFYTQGFYLSGGGVIDWLPDEDGYVLMERNYLPDDHIGSHLGSKAEGLGVDRIDTRTLAIKHVETPNLQAYAYRTDGHGTVRIMATAVNRGTGQETGLIHYFYRTVGSNEWRHLVDYNESDGSGMDVYAVDRDLNIAYGFKKKDGRKALYSLSLDANPHEELVYGRDDVDIDSVVRIGRRRHVVGATFDLDTPRATYFEPTVKSLMISLARALPESGLHVVESSVDEQKMLVYSGSDRDPGVYYLFDRPGKQLQTFLVSRSQLEGVKLAQMKAITYAASDGTSIPAYLTLPPGHEDAKGLPAIVMPHGGPSARDSWGFDWLAQFYAARGFAVMQPNFRGSSGYGDAWLPSGGFRQWKVSIGDVLDAGRWLAHEGIADPSKLAIVGWSYGGYAALQSAIVDSSVFKAVVAIAPVTDLGALKQESYYFSNYELISDFVGEGSQMREGSPAEHADRIKVPVMLFHGDLDRNVSIEQSKRMAARLTAAGGRCELVEWPELDHQLDDSAARELLLRKSDDFLRKQLGL